MPTKYKRCLLKISGESLAGDNGFGFDQPTIDDIAAQIVEINRHGVETAVVVGGGNVWRGLPAANGGMDRYTADQMGMLATVMNSLSLCAAVQAQGVDCCIESAIDMPPVARLFDMQRTMDALAAGKVVIFAAGSGHPYFSTDTAAALRAAEIHADALLMAKKVDGVYDSDPKTNPDAKRFKRLSYLDIISKELRVMDLTAAALCRDNNLSIVVFDITKPGNMLKAVKGEDIGTIVEV